MKASELEEIRRASRMSPLIFGALLLALLYLAALFSATPQRNATTWTLTAFAFGSMTALMWNRWIGPGAQWFVRAALLAILVGLASIVLEWLPRQNVFYTCAHCRAGTLWPLFALWAAGVALVLAILFGANVAWARMRHLGARSALAWVTIAAWTLACAWILARNVDAAVLWATVAGPGKALLVVGAVMLAGYALLSLLSRGTKRKRREAAADFERMGAVARAQVRTLIERQARQGEFAVAHHVGASAIAGAVGAAARIGGSPWRADGEPGPRSASRGRRARECRRGFGATSRAVRDAAGR